MENTVQNRKNKLKNHPSIKILISTINPNKGFSFCLVSCNEILKQMANLDTKKAIQLNDIQTNLLKQSSYFFSNLFYKNDHQCIKMSKCTSDFKLQNVTSSSKIKNLK